MPETAPYTPPEAQSERPARLLVPLPASMRDRVRLPQKAAVPTPPRPESTVTIDTSLQNRARQIIESSVRAQGDYLPAAELGKYTDTFTGVLQALPHDERLAFVQNPYVRDNLLFLLNHGGELNTHKIRIALQVSQAVDTLAQEQKYDVQFLPALKTASFVVIEKLREKGLTAGSLPNSGTAANAHQSLEAEYALRKTDMGFGERALYRHTLTYLANLDPKLHGEAMEQALTAEVSKSLHRQLKTWTDETRWLGQSQGIEIEVLKQGGQREQEKATARGVEKKWHDRAVPKGVHTRHDWYLLPMLGLKEDAGERKFQHFEIATDPSETAADQALTSLLLMSGGFITEGILSDDTKDNARKGKEAFSLHISTVFPKAIITTDTLSEYRTLARSLAGAYATDQRISYGGFKSGSRVDVSGEIMDKSNEGAMRSVPTVDSASVAGKALVEVRNLDISARDHLRAMLHKETLDFMFRCAWEQRMATGPQTPIETYAAGKYGDLMGDIQSLNTKFHIAPEQLQQRFGEEWESHAWQEMARAREQNPQLKTEYNKLIKKYTEGIRREYHAMVSPEERARQAGERAKRLDQTRTINREQKEVLQHTAQRYITIEPKGSGDNNVYLDGDTRARLGVHPEETMQIRLGGQILDVQVREARRRDDGTIDGPSNSPYMRVSRNILESFGLPKDTAILPQYDAQNRAIRLQTLETENPLVVKFVAPRRLAPESRLTARDTIGLSVQEQQTLGVGAGDEITIRFGRNHKKVRVAQLPQTATEQAQWSVSNNVSQELGIPSEISLRSRFDKTAKQLVLGPSIAFFSPVTDEGGNINIGNNGYFRQLARQAEEHGAFACVVDEHQNPETLARGYVDVYVIDPSQSGDKRPYKKVQIPIPDIIYDKHIGMSAEKTTLVRKFEHRIIPPKEQAIAVDKLAFAQLLQEKGLGEFHPETMSFGESELETRRFLQKHGEIIVKPRKGMGGKSIFLLSQREGKYALSTPQKNHVFAEADNLQELLQRANELPLVQEYGGLQEFLAQEKVEAAEYRYKDPLMKDDITGKPEPRIITQRGIDGNIRVGGIVTRVANNRGGPHMQDTQLALASMFPEEKAQRVLADIRKLSSAVHRAVEEAMGGVESGELTIDMIISTSGKPIILEVNSKGSNFPLFRHVTDQQGNPLNPKSRTQQGVLRDGRYNLVAGPIEYALYKTGMA